MHRGKQSAALQAGELLKCTWLNKIDSARLVGECHVDSTAVCVFAGTGVGKLRYLCDRVAGHLTSLGGPSRTTLGIRYNLRNRSCVLCESDLKNGTLY